MVGSEGGRRTGLHFPVAQVSYLLRLFCPTPIAIECGRLPTKYTGAPWFRDKTEHTHHRSVRPIVQPVQDTGHLSAWLAFRRTVLAAQSCPGNIGPAPCSGPPLNDR